MIITKWQKISAVCPTLYHAKIENGKMLVVHFRWEQLRIFISKRPTDNIKSAQFPNGDLILNKIIKPTHPDLHHGELKEEFIMKELKKLKFTFFQQLETI